MADELPPSLPRSFRRSLAIQTRVIWALILRELLTRYGRHNLGLFWLYVEPMMFTIGVTILWYAIGANHGSNLPIMAFALTGYSTILLWRNMPNRVVMAVSSNLALMYHRNVRVIDLFASRLLLEFISISSSFFFLTILFWFTGYMDPPEDLLELCGAWLMTAWFGASLALFLGAVGEKSELVEKLWHPLAYILFPLSGAAFIADAIPPGTREKMLLIPMVHCTEMVREAFFGSKIVAHYSVGYLLSWNLSLTIIGLAIERQLSREIIPE
ncbi:sugar ABC transporter permease [Sphingomonas oleivorans]|uniref:Sugar ABC transporter permease n=1 Tax=Sphingomonas oleivorans TaxID=1735121 RepID=A0A2T5FV84_9SPHN|nr:ABC transporter permease [Sphingomonas oleivorans]PTQ09110.1 sugar ABC transporter permease [Sphingomonas oleivorans]